MMQTRYSTGRILPHASFHLLSSKLVGLKDRMGLIIALENLVSEPSAKEWYTKEFRPSLSLMYHLFSWSLRNMIYGLGEP